MTSRSPHIVITRPTEQAHTLADDLRTRGFTPLLYPGLSFRPCTQTARLDTELKRLAAGDYDLMILTSGQAAQSVSERTAALALSLKGRVVWTVGHRTAAACHFEADIRTPPDARDALTLLAALPDLRNQRVLLPQSPLAAPTLTEGLAARGATVTVIHPYEVVAGEGGDDVPHLMQQGQIDALTFFSSSAVEGVVARLEASGISLSEIQALPAICFGQQTAATARAYGLTTWEGDATYTTFYHLLEQVCRQG